MVTVKTCRQELSLYVEFTWPLDLNLANNGLWTLVNALGEWVKPLVKNENWYLDHCE